MLYLNYNEKQQHGTSEFPVAFYHVDTNHPRYEMPFHWHKEYELVRVLEGSFRLLVNDEEIAAATGDVLFIPSGVLHGGIPEGCIYECLVFDLDILFVHSDSCRQYLKKIARLDILLPPLITADSPLLLTAVGRLFAHAARQSAGYELMVMGCLFEFFGIIYKNETYTENQVKDVPAHNHTAELKSVFEYIEGNYASAISLQQLSLLSGMSPKYFCRYFQTIAHRTPMDYLNYYRIERSCSLLCTTDLPVTAIAYDCGFNDCSYFVKTFRKYKNTTPKQYQMQMRGI